MQDAWWYLAEDGQQGPVSMEQLDALLLAGTISPQSLVWTAGQADWLPLLQVQKCARELHLAPAPASPQRSEAPLAGAWRRFCARMLDIWVLSFSTQALLLLLLALVSPISMDWLKQLYFPYLLALLIFPLVMLLEAGVYAYFGNTLGKAFFGVTVVTQGGRRLTAVQYLRRQVDVFWYGLAMGLPFVHLLAMASQAVNLSRGEPAGYDAGKFAVVVTEGSWLRTLLLGGAVLSVFCAAMLAAVLAEGLGR